uniref:SERPIN domain-containing protein n=1 Tax=Macrostomum lignano TaxID=282301 RepID=A0A1I8F1R7_9PLAT
VSRQLFYRLFSSHQDVAQPDSLRAAAEAAGLSADVTAAALTDMLSGRSEEPAENQDGRQEMVFGSDRFHIIGTFWVLNTKVH